MSEDLAYSVSLADQMSGPANAAAHSLENLSKHAHEVQGGLLGLSGGLLKTIEPTEVLRHAFEGVEAGLKTFASSLASGEAKGAVEGLTESLAGMAQLLDLVVPGLGQLASAAIKAGGAIAAMTVGLLQSSAELALEQTGLRERLMETFEALGDGPGAGKATLDMLDSLSSKLPQSRAQLVEWTKTYQALGITDLGGIQHQLLATASAQAIMGDSGAAAYEHLTKKIQTAIETHQGLKIAGNRLAELAAAGVNVAAVANRMGISAEDLAHKLKKGTVDAQAFGDALSDALIEKGQGPLAAMGAELSTQLAKAREAGARLFDSVDAKPFLSQMRSLLGIFDSSQPSAQAAKWAITGLLDGAFALAAKALPPIKHFFLGLEIGALRSYIAAKPLIAELKKLFGGVEGGHALEDSLHTIGAAIEFIVRSTISAVTGVTRLLNLGKAAGDGIATGLASATGAVSNAASGLADAAKKGVVDTLDIHSPSRVMVSLGHFTGAGFATGLQAQAPNTERAAVRLGTVAAIRAPEGASRGAASGGEGRSIVIHVGGVHIAGGAGGTMEVTETAIAAMFERLALSQGL